MKYDKPNFIIDNNDVRWIFNGERLYVDGSDEEFLEDGINVMENGYMCNSLPQAFTILSDEGYLDI